MQRLARLAARNPRRTIIVWLVAVVGCLACAPLLLSAVTTEMGAGNTSESGHADARRAELFRSLPQRPTEMVGATLFAVVDGWRVEDPRAEVAVRQAASAIAALQGVHSVRDAYSSTDPGLRSLDGLASAVVVTLELRPDVRVDRTAEEIEAILQRTGAPSVLVGNESLADDEIDAQAKADLARGEIIALPLAFLALILTLGGLLAATLPLALAVVSMAGALVVLLIATAVGDVAVYALNVVTMFGVGVGVDYGLIFVSRFREERSAGHDSTVSLHRSIATAGRAITYSGLTVAAALSGLLVFESPGLRSLAIGGIGVVLVAVLAGMSLFPALLSIVGRRLRPARARSGRGFFWHVANRVRRAPASLLAVLIVGLVVAALPLLGARFENPDARSLPASSVAHRLEDARSRFAGRQADPLVVLAMTTPADPSWRPWFDTLKALPGVERVDVEEGLATAGAAVFEVVPTGATQGDIAQRLVGDLRDLDPPFEHLVGGDAAELVDLKDSIAARLWWALGLVGLATVVLLFLMTGSVIVALKAVATNLLSLGATFGVLVWVFQDGHLSGQLGFEPVGALDVTVTLVLFLFAFGLSMDYEVFLLSRIKEAWDETGDNDLAVAHGMQRSGRIISSAAFLLVIVFAGFAAGQLLLVKQLGVGLAVAVLVDATIVRSLLVPAAMSLMGRWNWWAPAPLRALHRRFGLSGRQLPGEAPVPVPLRAADH